jgi:hypothetical protein
MADTSDITNILPDVPQPATESEIPTIPAEPTAPVINTVGAPIVRGSTPEQLQQEQDKLDAQQQAVPSFGQGMSMAADIDHILPNAVRIGSSINTPVDPEFQMTPELWESTIVGIAPEHQEALLDAVSLPDLKQKQQRILAEQENERKLGSMGWSGVGARLLADMLDPVAIGAIAASGGAAAPWMLGSRLARIGKSALSAAGMNTALTGVAYLGNETYEAKNILYAAAAGGALGALGKGISTRHMARDADIEFRFAETSAAIQREMDGITPSAVHIEGTASELVDDSVGAARNTTQYDPIHDNLDIGDEIETLRDTKSAFAGARFSTAARLKNSNNPVLKWIGHNWVEDGVSGGKPTASLISSMEAQRWRGKFLTVFEQQFTEHKAALRTTPAGFSPTTLGKRLVGLEDARLRKEFNILVTQEQRGFATGNAQASKVAKALRENHTDILRKMKAAGVAGADNVPENSNYIPREWLPESIRNLAEVHGTAPVQNFLKNAVMRGSPDLPEKLAERYAKAIYKRYHEKSAGIQPSGSTGLFGASNLDELEEMLGDLDLDNFDSLLRDDIVAHFRQADELKLERGTTAGNLKKRIQMDENYSEIMRDNRGNAKTVHISDFLENDAEKLHSNYIRRMSGHIGLAKTGIKSSADFQELLRKIEKEGSAARLSSDTIKEQKDAVSALYNHLLGRPPVDNIANRSVVSGLRFIRALNYGRLMGQLGLASVGELGNITSTFGIKTMLQHMPDIRMSLKGGAALNAPVNSPLFRELEDLVGVIGQDRLLNHPTARIDEFGAGVGGEGSLVNNAETSLQYINRSVTDLSGHHLITSYFQRLTATAIAQKFLNVAHGSKFNPKRMAYLGLDEAMLPRVLHEIKTHSISTPNVITGRKLRELNINNWTDTEALEAFRSALFREGNRVIQRGLLGESNMFLNTTIGKTLGQFRTFQLTAWDKQLLHNIKMADPQTARMFIDTTAFGGLAYYLQTKLNAEGREDKQEFLEKHLSIEAIGKGAFMKAGYSALLPGGYDSVAGLSGGFIDSQFSYGRSTGQASNFITGNPTMSFLGKAGGAIESGVGMFNSDYEYSKQNIQDQSGLMMYSNSYGIKNLLQYMQIGKPRQSMERTDD